MTESYSSYEEVEGDEAVEEVEAYESTVEEEVVEPEAPTTVKLQVVYSKLNYQGTVYNVGDVLELTEEEADELLGALSGRQYRHLEVID